MSETMEKAVNDPEQKNDDQLVSFSFTNSFRASLKRHSWLFWIFLAVGLFGAIWCSSNHFCKCGHMAHPPYAAWEHVFEIAKKVSLACALIIGVFKKMWFGLVIAAAMFLLFLEGFTAG